MQEQSKISKMALLFWMMGFSIITFDHGLAFDFKEFTIKAYYFLFLISGLLIIRHFWMEKNTSALLKTIIALPWFAAVCLAIYQLSRAPFSLMPLKSFVYTAWLGFDIVIVGILGGLAIRLDPERARRYLLWVISLSSIALCAVLITDHIAYYFGYISGLIGYNQDRFLHWGISRPHAFAYEPSYLGLYFSIGFPFLLADIMQKKVKSTLPFALSLASCAAIAAGLFILGSRTGWVATTLSLGLLLALEKFRVPKLKIISALVVAFATILLVIFVSPQKQIDLTKRNLVTSVIKGQDGSGNVRLRSMLQAVDLAKESNFLGVGVGGSHAVIVRKIHPMAPLDTGAEAIMSIWAQVLAESGLPGVFFLVVFGGTILRGTLSKMREWADPFNTALFVTSFVFFLFSTHWVGNIARTDAWVWIAIWGAFGNIYLPSQAVVLQAEK